MDAVFWVSYAALWVVVVVQGLAFLELVRQAAQMREALQIYEGPKEQLEISYVGEVLPHSNARFAATGEPVRWQDLLGRDLSVLVVLHPGCLTCHAVAEGLPRLIATQHDGVSIVPLVEGRNLEAARAFMEELRLDPARCVLDEEPSLSRSLNLTMKPGAVVLFGKQVSSAATVKSASQVEILVRDGQARLRARQRGDGPLAAAEELAATGMSSQLD
jgi:hypothetical protein